MAITALQAANLFIEKAKNDKPLTHLQLQKLIYFLHGWGYPLCGGELISDTPQAWKLGPVYPSVYDKFSDNGSKPIVGAIEDEKTPSLNETEETLLNTVYDVYSKSDGLKLSWLTHQEGTPWYEIYIEKKKRNKHPISPKLIEEHFMNAHEEYEERVHNER